MSSDGFIREIEEALSGQAIGYRADALRRVTDLFVSAPARYSEAEVAIFDEVMMRLVEDMETSLRATLARRLASIPNAPHNLIRRLAADGSIEVAGPVLRTSQRLDDLALVANARTGSQDHLLAISQRPDVSEPVTDVLVERGDRAVALSVVGNAGARFSEAGREILLERAKDDDRLAAGIWSRTDIPRHQLLQLFSVASEVLRQKLEAADRTKAHLITDMLRDVANQFQRELRAQSHAYVEAERTVVALRRNGELDEAKVGEFAAAGRFDETTVALSILCDLPIGACERAMVQNRAELMLMLAKAVGLSWRTTRSILCLRAGPGGISSADLEQNLDTFTKLRLETARKALVFLRLRERASGFPHQAT